MHETDRKSGILDKIGKIILRILAVINLILVIGAFFGIFDKNPIPFIIFVGIVLIFGILEKKFPKVPSIVLAVLEIIALIVCFNLAGNAGTVASVKGGSPESYPNISYEKAFDNYFSEPTWKNVGKDEDGNEVVKFTGNCYYLDEEATVEVKFTVYKEQNSFVVSSVKINGQDMGLLKNSLIIAAFDEYEQSH